ncbi:tyrosine-type recombinase/integrase [Hymenobacter sp. APR13]|uniref:tyrosine-type recombinase/integrase n=1 Tax=Hymenobacter sp. APR13 TaxID=1356852 RepID=UPI0004E084AE|nr:tyrosine-type recombinase/integrase [Hymenobacter sp. APR13]AII50369.1 hypothetical protein N008_00015 [Hymenobacter sp. APR13]
MARPKAEFPTITTILRADGKYATLKNKPIQIRWSFGTAGSFKIPTLHDAHDKELDKSGYLKPSNRVDRETINRYLQDIRDRLTTAYNLVVADGVMVTDKLVKERFEQLTTLAQQQQEEATRLAIKREKFEQKLAGMITTLHEEGAVEAVDVVIPRHESAIEKLKAQIAHHEAELYKTKREYDLLPEPVEAEDAKLTTWLMNYAQRQGKNTLAATTLRTYTSFVSTVARFRPNVLINEVDDSYLIAFQDWLTDTPSMIPKYSYVKKQKVEQVGWTEGKTRTNETVENYITKIKSCLKYYLIHDDKLPAGIKVNTKYQRYEFLLAKNNDEVITLEEEEILALKDLQVTKNDRKAQLLLLFLCATGLRWSDAITITSANISNGYIRKSVKKTEKKSTVVHIKLNPISEYVLEQCEYDISKIAMEDYYAVELMRELCKLIPSMHDKIELKRISGRKTDIVQVPRWFRVGTHTGRRTHLNILLDYNVPVHAVMSIAGHTNLATLEGYLQERRTLKEHTLNIFNIPKQN